MSVAELTRPHQTTEGLYHRGVVLEAERLLNPTRRTTAEMHDTGLYPYERYPGYVENRAKTLLSDAQEAVDNSAPKENTFSEDAKEIDALREDLYRAIPEARDNDGGRTYDIVYDVWRMQKIVQETPSLGERQKRLGTFRKYLDLQLVTHLRENCNVYDHTTAYSFRGDDMYMDILSMTQPFDVIAARGVVIAEKDGSVDTKREQNELRGVIAMGEYGRFAPVGSRYMLISGRGITENTRYTNFYIDIGEVVESDGKQFLNVTRFKSDASHEAAVRIAQQINSSYLDSKNVDTPLDAYEVGTLIALPTSSESAQDLYEGLFGKNPQAMRESTFETEVHRVTKPYKERYMDAIVQQKSWQEISNAYEDMVVAQQHVVEQLQQHMQEDTFLNLSRQQNSPIATDMGAAFYRQQQIKTSSSGCGTTKSYGRKGFLASILSSELLDNSVVQSSLERFLEELGLSSEGEIHWHTGVCRLCSSEKDDPSEKLVGDCDVCTEHQAEFDSGKRK